MKHFCVIFFLIKIGQKVLDMKTKCKFLFQTEQNIFVNSEDFSLFDSFIEPLSFPPSFLLLISTPSWILLLL